MCGEQENFAEVYTRYLPMVSAYLARRVEREEVEDLAADVFAIAWRKRARVAAGEELPWLYRIASYQVANHRRKIAGQERAFALLAVTDAAPYAETFRETDPVLVKAWRNIPAKHREILALVVFDELPINQLATTLGISPNAVSIRLHRAKKALVTELKKISERFGGDAT